MLFLATVQVRQTAESSGSWGNDLRPRTAHSTKLLTWCERWIDIMQACKSSEMQPLHTRCQRMLQGLVLIKSEAKPKRRNRGSTDDMWKPQAPSCQPGIPEEAKSDVGVWRKGGELGAEGRLPYQETIDCGENMGQSEVQNNSRTVFTDKVLLYSLH